MRFFYNKRYATVVPTLLQILREEANIPLVAEVSKILGFIGAEKVPVVLWCKSTTSIDGKVSHLTRSAWVWGGKLQKN